MIAGIILGMFLGLAYQVFSNESYYAYKRKMQKKNLALNQKPSQFLDLDIEDVMSFYSAYDKNRAYREWLRKEIKQFKEGAGDELF